MLVQQSKDFMCSGINQKISQTLLNLGNIHAAIDFLGQLNHIFSGAH